MKIRTVVLGILLIVFFLDSGQGFSLLGYKWQEKKYDYFVNPSNGDGLTSAAIIASLKGAAAAWKTWCPGTYKGLTTAKTVSFNNKNTVFFRAKKQGQTIGTCYTYFSGNKILDFDLVFWDAAWKFFTGATGCVRGYYVQDIAAHELGHAIGIGHSTVLIATMFPTTIFCDTSIRTLADDDKKAANKNY